MENKFVHITKFSDLLYHVFTAIFDVCIDVLTPVFTLLYFRIRSTKTLIHVYETKCIYIMHIAEII
jgi:hypothetical protein